MAARKTTTTSSTQTKKPAQETPDTAGELEQRLTSESLLEQVPPTAGAR